MQSSSALRCIVFRKTHISILKLSSLPAAHLLNRRCMSTTSTTEGTDPTTSVNDNLSIVSSFSSEADSSVKSAGSEVSQANKASISKAMQAYLKRARENQEFMANQEKEFVFGRRHLANMMGKDPESFTQKDIDEAIRYLFPSGLYNPRSRPLMRPPAEVYPKQKAAQFDASGRPHHPFFYTANPNFYYLLHEMTGKLETLSKLASSRSDTDLTDDSSIAGTVWLTKDELEKRLLEKISEPMYNDWITCFERLASHPKKEKEIEFIKAYRKPLEVQGKADSSHPVTLEPDGRKTVHVPICMKKSARAEVLVTVPGTGEFNLNGKGLDYFKRIQSRLAVISPLQLVGWLGKCDIEANIVEGGIPEEKRSKVPRPMFMETSKAICVRYGIAHALVSLGADAEKLRLAGYLQHDIRVKERKKPGRDGARARWTWKKR